MWFNAGLYKGMGNLKDNGIINRRHKCSPGCVPSYVYYTLRWECYQYVSIKLFIFTVTITRYQVVVKSAYLAWVPINGLWGVPLCQCGSGTWRPRPPLTWSEVWGPMWGHRRKLALAKKLWRPTVTIQITRTAGSRYLAGSRYPASSRYPACSSK